MAVAMTTNKYGHLGAHLASGRIDWANDNLRLTLHDNTYTPDPDNDIWVSDLTGELSTGGGYTVGGVALDGSLLTYDDSGNVTGLDLANVTISNSTLSWHYAVISDRTPSTASTQPLIAYLVPATQPVASTGGDTTITFDAQGLFEI